MARTVAFFYTLFLHCLVFLVGYPSYPRGVKTHHNYSLTFFFVKFRYCTRLHGARASAETAPLTALKSEFIPPTAGGAERDHVGMHVMQLVHSLHLYVAARYSDHLHRFHENDPNL